MWLHNDLCPATNPMYRHVSVRVCAFLVLLRAQSALMVFRDISTTVGFASDSDALVRVPAGFTSLLRSALAELT